MIRWLIILIGLFFISALPKSGISQNIELNVEIDSMVVYGSFKAFDIGSSIESKFVEVHLFLRIEIHNNSEVKLRVPKEIYFGKSSTADIFYRIERYTDSIKTFQKYHIGSELPAFRELDDSDFIEISPRDIYQLRKVANYCIPLNQAHRISLTANFNFNEPKIVGIESNWLNIEKTPINHSIRVINKYLPE